MSGATVGAREITIRGVVLGALITLVFTAANVYLGLRVGLTFATSIPAAVISMGVLRLFANHSVVENNIVQTILFRRSRRRPARCRRSSSCYRHCS